MGTPVRAGALLPVGRLARASGILCARALAQGAPGSTRERGGSWGPGDAPPRGGLLKPSQATFFHPALPIPSFLFFCKLKVFCNLVQSIVA